MTIPYQDLPKKTQQSQLTISELTSNIREALDACPGWDELFAVADNEKSEADDTQSMLDMTYKDAPNSHTYVEVSENAAQDVLLSLNILFGEACQLGAKEINAWCRTQLLFTESIPQFNFGLVQLLNGPCGVLVALQCWMIVYVFLNLYYSRSDQNDSMARQHPFKLTLSQQHQSLSWVVAVCLYRATKRSVYRTVKFDKMPCVTQETFDANKFMISNPFKVYEHTHISSVYQFFRESIQQNEPASFFDFIMSLILTKTPSKVQQDLDDPLCPLVAEHGHSTQEFVNLILTGQANSNVFDGNRDLGGASTNQLKGIQKRQVIGFLTKLECYGYCEVGQFFKSPLLPIWVIGNMDHYTASFGTDPRICIESKSEQNMKEIKRVFDLYDPESTSFISSRLLHPLLEQCRLGQYLNEARNLLDPPDQGGVILRYDFMEWAESKILSSVDKSCVKIPNEFCFIHYDGQVPGGPQLLEFRVLVLDFLAGADYRNSANAEIEAVLRTKWPHLIVFDSSTS